MSKTYVIDEEAESRVPFLRGMLVKSLQRAGLDFAEAYHVATDVRDDLEDIDDITIIELRERIEAILREDFPGKVLIRYKKEDISHDVIKVQRGDGNIESFSRGVHAQRLEICDIPISKSTRITRKIHSYLIRQKRRLISSDELTALTSQYILEEHCQKSADYYLIWHDFMHSDTPLILLVGGVPGSGKSTVANEVANHLGIVRTQSTDMLREVMRIMIPERLSPSLHTSSFTAGASIQLPESDNKSDQSMLYGYQMQSEMVEVACDAVIQRALNENVSIILEGVHIRPTLLNRVEKSQAIVVPVFIAVLQQKRLVKYFKGRSLTNKNRRARRYIKNIDDIWQLQSTLISEADHHDIEIIDNIDLRESVMDVVSTITATVAASYRGRLRELRRKYRI